MKSNRLFALAATLTLASLSQADITGFVYNDLNRNGIKDAGENGIPNVMVSDQTVVVLTDKTGAYKLPDTDNVTVFVSTPEEFEAPLDPKTCVPQFYRNIFTKNEGLFKANGAKKTDVNFPLYRRMNATDLYKICVHADPQTPGQEQLNYYREDILDAMYGQGYDFMVTLGDITGDNLPLLAKIAAAQGMNDIPNYGVIGNHDRNYDATTMPESSIAFKLVYGPDYYSFTRGKQHYVALNTVYFNNKKSGYENGLDAKQLAWLKANLANVPKDKEVVLMMHIPIIPYSPDEGAFHGKAELFKILSGREAPILALGGHWHTNTSVNLGPKEGWTDKQPFQMVVVPTASGSWWSGPKDYRGVPTADQADGTPNGYSVWTFNGTKYLCDFKPASMNEEFQARIYTPDMHLPELRTTTVLVNFFMAPMDAKVELAFDKGPWETMERVDIEDPQAAALFNGPYSNAPSWMGPTKSLHIWKGAIPDNIKKGLHQVKTRTTLLDGRDCVRSKTFMMP